MTTFFWHDYETFGIDPQRDRACQFAGVRTDEDFNPLGEPLTVYCQLADDYLPQPDACLITGITPQLANQRGVCEAEFIRRIHEQMAQPNTCSLGYNTIRFDDEFTRNLLYRNFYDPYGREWQNNNSRWDLIDVVRATHALRPDGIVWPKNDDGVTSFRLELLTAANGLGHDHAHDALSDVYATIAFAKLLREQQPKLYHYLYNNRLKAEAASLLKLGQFVPLVHVSGMYAAKRHCLAVVLPLCAHPDNANGVVVYDLAVDPEPLLTLSVDEIKTRLFTPSAELAEGVERIPLKTVHINKCPVLAPLATLRPQDQERLTIDLARCQRHAQQLTAAAAELTAKINQVLRSDYSAFAAPSDPDLMIYSGGFLGQQDKNAMAKIRSATPEQLAALTPSFQDERLNEMLWRYKGRNYPATLTAEEQQQWRHYCQQQLSQMQPGRLNLAQFNARLAELQQQPDTNQTTLAQLAEFAGAKQAQLAL